MISDAVVNKNLSKEEIYRAILPQIREIIKGESDLIANTANIVSLLKYSFSKFLWVGFYFYNKENKELILGPFQGNVACTRIQYGRGVCGSAVKRHETIIVEDVTKFPGHIYCDSDSKSEIVVPVIKNNEVKAVLDIDSSEPNMFDSIDKNFLEELINDISYIF